MSTTTTAKSDAPKFPEQVTGMYISAEALMEDPNNIGKATYMSGHEIGIEGLAAMEPGMSYEVMETERVHMRTGARRWFM